MYPFEEKKHCLVVSDRVIKTKCPKNTLSFVIMENSKDHKKYIQRMA